MTSGFRQLNLWADEEERLHKCLRLALQALQKEKIVQASDDELVISGKLRPHIRRVKRRVIPYWTFHSEVSAFDEADDPIPVGHPDFQFSIIDNEKNQIDYDIEAKRVRVKDGTSKMDHCKAYVINGINRYVKGVYGQSVPFGAMLGYVQNSQLPDLLDEVNRSLIAQSQPVINLLGKWKEKGVSFLGHLLNRNPSDGFTLSHIWADFRK